MAPGRGKGRVPCPHSQRVQGPGRKEGFLKGVGWGGGSGEVGGLAENFSTQFPEWGRRRAGKRRGLGAGVPASGWERGRARGCERVWWAPRGSRPLPGALRPRRGPAAPPAPPRPRGVGEPEGPPRRGASRSPLPLPLPTPSGPSESPRSVRFRRPPLAVEADLGLLLYLIGVCECACKCVCWRE